MLPLIQRAEQFNDRIAIADPTGEYTYAQLLKESRQLAQQLLGRSKDLKEARIGFMVRPGYHYVRCQWAIWQAGGIAVPICVSYPAPSIEYVLRDAEISKVTHDTEFEGLLGSLCKRLNIPVIEPDFEKEKKSQLPDINTDRRAMMLYTSGTTGNPKGVVSRHDGIQAQIEMLVNAWHWQSDDRILNILPLHHVHGIVNVLSCAMWSGACCEFLPAFGVAEVFEVFKRKQVNLFMAVPTIYYKLISYWEGRSKAVQNEITNSFKDFRLMVSGSAALPVSTLEKWRTISQQTLLERYGMTEIGMAISNPYDGERKPGYIGQPLPGVTVRLVDDKGDISEEGEPGEIQVKGANVFHEYWNRPEATKEAFTLDGWFKTGDIAKYENGSYKILGRNSVDIINSGGFKISSLEIQEVLRTHPAIKDCGVVGIPDEEWGEVVAAGLVTNEGAIDFDSLKDWLKDRLPPYKVPRKYLILEDLPRNVMGKVTKHKLKLLF